jgi:hypothetical protein
MKRSIAFAKPSSLYESVVASAQLVARGLAVAASSAINEARASGAIRKFAMRNSKVALTLRRTFAAGR